MYCHVWDYEVIAGDLRRTTVSTAFVVLSSVFGLQPKKLVQFLISSSHRAFVSFMPDDAINALGLFLSHGQHDFKVVTGAKGDPRRGKDIYEGVCIRCHEAGGTAPIYGEKGDRSSLGWIARNRPEQAIHKIRNGVPNADMVEMRFLDLQSMKDLLVYLQSLDRK